MFFIMQEPSNNLPLVSIIIPVYNAEKYLFETISSVISQSFTSWQIIAVNDGSKDNSLRLLDGFKEELGGKLLIYSKLNTGVSDTRNIGISKAKTKYIAFLDADDQWLYDNLKIKIDFLETNPDYGFVFSDMNYVDANLNNPIPAEKGKDENILNDLLLWNGEVIPGPCSNLVVRSTCLENIRFKKNLSTIADQNLTVQLAYYFKGKRIPEFLWNYRVLPGSMSKSVRVMAGDSLNTYIDYWKSGYFRSKKFQLKCFSNMYLIVAGSYWKDADEKWKGVEYMFKSVFCYPPNFFKIFDKLKKIIQ